jgi:rare lipoprotein A
MSLPERKRIETAGPAKIPPLPPRNERRQAAASPKHETAQAGAKPAPPQTGRASWYDFHGQTTANGETMDRGALTAAHRSLPLGSLVVVENLDNGSEVEVRINDRGPFVGGRIIDLGPRQTGRRGTGRSRASERLSAQPFALSLPGLTGQSSKPLRCVTTKSVITGCPPARA